MKHLNRAKVVVVAATLVHNVDKVGGGGGVGLRDGSVVRDGSSNKAPIADRGTSSLLKTELIPGSHGLSTRK